MDTNPLARLARRGQRPAGPALPDRLGGADAAPGALTTLEREPEEQRPTAAPPPVAPSLPPAADAEPTTGRFTVDLAEWGEAAPPAAEARTSDTARRTSPWRLLGRLVLVVALSLVAFRHSVGSLVHAIAGGSVLVYVLAVPLLAGLAAAARARRPGYQVAGGVRVRDVALGVALCLVSLGVSTLLGPGLSGVYAVWRLDLLMLWLFLLGATVLSFGLGQVLRSWPFWAVLLLVWPFPVRLANSALLGALGGGVLLCLVVVAVVALGHRRGDPPRWQVLGSTVLAAVVTLALCALTTHPTRIEWPGVVTALVAAAWWVCEARPVERTPLVERRVRGTSVALVGLTLLGFLMLPPAPRSVPPSAPSRITALAVGPLVVPGYATTATSVSAEQQRYFGKTSTWQRVRLQQGDPVTGPTPGGREIVVDVTSTPRPQALDLYPVVTTYPMGTLSSTPDAEVDLGHGVLGQVFRGDDARHDITYTLLTFSWRLPVDMSIMGGYVGPPAQLTQRVTLIAVDDRRPGAAFPQPGNAVLDGVKAAVTDAWADQHARPRRALEGDEQLLDVAARGLVEQRLTGG